MTFRSTLFALSVIAAPSALLAQPVTGPYVSLGAGVNYLQDQNTKIGAGVGSVGTTDMNVGPAGVAAAGWGFGNGFRAELQGIYVNNKIYKFGGLTSSGYNEQYGGFVNAYYDFDLSGSGLAGITPYLGVGGGFEIQHLQNVTVNPYPELYRSTGTDDVGAVQAIVGVSYDVTQVPGLALTAEYRFTAVPEDITRNGQLLSPCCSQRASNRMDSGLNHTALLGFRYALWSPAPPPPPEVTPPPAVVPAVEPARTYLVFFDWDRADLSPRAREIVAQAATASTHVQTTKIEVNGYTDLSGTAAYNQKLSVRRAKAVESELVKDGVAEAAIDIHGYGESNPLVPTAKGVREPQNRRVEIILK